MQLQNTVCVPILFAYKRCAYKIVYTLYVRAKMTIIINGQHSGLSEPHSKDEGREYNMWTKKRWNLFEINIDSADDYSEGIPLLDEQNNEQERI